MQVGEGGLAVGARFRAGFCLAFSFEVEPEDIESFSEGRGLICRRRFARIRSETDTCADGWHVNRALPGACVSARVFRQAGIERLKERVPTGGR